MLVLCLVLCSDVGLMFWCSLTILKCSWTYVYVWLTMIVCCVYSSHGQTTPDICAPGLKSTKAFQPGAAAASKWRSHSRGSSSWRRSQFLGDAHPRGNVRSYSVVSDLLCVLLWITHGSLMISLTLTIWILWILWSDFFSCYSCQTGIFMRWEFVCCVTNNSWGPHDFCESYDLNFLM